MLENSILDVLLRKRKTQEADQTRSSYRFKEEEYLPLYETWVKTKSPDALTVLVDKLSPLLDYAIHYYASDIASSPSLRIKAKKLLIDAIKSYDPSKGLLTHHVFLNLQRLKRIGGQTRQIIRQSEQVSMDLNMLNQAEEELIQTLGRLPNTEELADYTGLSIERIKRIRQKAVMPLPEATTVRQTAEGLSELPTQALGQGQDVFTQLLELAYIDADPVDKAIMELYYGLHGRPRMSQKDIANKLRLSPGRVSQRISEIEERVKYWYDLQRGNL